MKRFYKDVTIAPQDGGFAVLLDGRPVRTPGGNALSVGTENLAKAIAAEWAGQGETIDPTAMHLLQLQNTLQDRAQALAADWQGDLQAYLETDLLLYHAAAPEGLVSRQKATWLPWIDWMEGKGLTRLPVTTTLSAITVPPDVEAFIAATAQSQPMAGLMIWRHAAGLTGSTILGLALLEGAATPAQAYEVARIEEQYYGDLANEGLHGKAPHQEKQDNALMAELVACQEFCRLALEP